MNTKVVTCDGMSLIELMVALGLVAIIFGGAFLSYSAILDTLMNSELRTAAVAVLNRELEIVRNLPYDSVGTVGGVPAGTLLRQKTILWKDINFLIITIVRNIDDPFDGMLGGAPNDTAPADYKTVELEISCPQCARFVPISMTTTVAPENLESTGGTGSIFIHTISASGEPIAAATVRVINTVVSPTIDLTDTTNNDGVLQLVGVPTSTDSYEIAVTKPGYSSEQTYPRGAPGNPNPIHPHATVQGGVLADVSFYVDALSSTTVYTNTTACGAVGDVPFTMTGSRLIGSTPDVVKISTSSQTDDRGIASFDAFEWDTYAVTANAAGYNLLAAIPFLPFTVDPGVRSELRLVYVPHAGPGALSTHVVREGSGAPLPNAYVTLSKTGYSKTAITGHAFLDQTTWGVGEYAEKTSGVDTSSVPGQISLGGPPYPTSTTHWLISNTFDAGSAASTTLFTLSWLPATQPPGAGPQSLAFQISANNDTVTWNFVGPDGTAATYFTESGTSIPAALSGKQYIRYKAFLQTVSGNETPTLQWIGIEYAGRCVPPASAYFDGLATGEYELRAAAVGYVDATSTVAIATGWQQQTMSLAPEE